MFIYLNDKVIVVTGSSKGIGAALIKKFADERSKVVINYNKSQESAEELAKLLDSKNIEYCLIKADLSQDKEVRFFYKEIKNKFGKIDILINNAGICTNGGILSTSENSWDNVINTNLKSVFLCTKYFSKLMIKQGYGKIINISSRYSEIGALGQASYASSKAAITSFTKTAAKELGQYGISVNAVYPGQIATSLEEIENSDFKEIYDYMDNIDYLDTLLNFIVYMCSDSFHSITGQVFYLDSRI